MCERHQLHGFVAFCVVIVVISRLPWIAQENWLWTSKMLQGFPSGDFGLQCCHAIILLIPWFPHSPSSSLALSHQWHFFGLSSACEEVDKAIDPQAFSIPVHARSLALLHHPSPFPGAIYRFIFCTSLYFPVLCILVHLCLSSLETWNLQMVSSVPINSCHKFHERAFIQVLVT